MALGMKGAALAALGEIPAGFLTGTAFEPLGDRKEGVKLGESTFNIFFAWLWNVRIGHEPSRIRTKDVRIDLADI